MTSESATPLGDPGGLAALRRSYDVGAFELADLRESPLAQFEEWLSDAVDSGVPDPNAMVLATAGTDGQPSTRTVLLKGIDERGLAFYTNLGSRKSTELAANPGVSCLFPWYAAHRQVVVVGRAELIGREEVDAYFVTRPRGSQYGAWASRQSSVIPDRVELERRFAELEREYGDDMPIPAPPFWGGWLVRPISIEFWQGRPNRLHDRLRFVATGSDASVARGEDWRVERLSP